MAPRARHNPFVIEFLRSVSRSLGRFLAIVAIVAIGCGFFAGLRMTGTGMRKSADIYYDGTELYDLQLVSTLGISENTVERVAETPGITAVMPSRSVDVMAAIGENQVAARVTSFDVEAAKRSSSDGVRVFSEDDGYLNRLILRTGRWPSAPNECVVLEERAEHLGRSDTVDVLYGATSLDDVLDVRDFDVVGTVSSTYYSLSSSLATTTLGSGILEQAVFVPEDAFDPESPYTECFMRVGDATDEITATEPYEAEVQKVEEELEVELDSFANERREEVRAEAQETLDEHRADFEEEKAEALAELDDAERELEDGLAELRRNQATVDDSEAELASGQADYEAGLAEIASSRKRLQDGEAAYASGQAEIASAERQVADARTQLADAEAQAAPEIERFDAAETAYQDGLAAYDGAVSDLVAQFSALTPGASTPEEIQAALPAVIEQLSAAAAAGVPGAEEQLAAARQAQAALDAAIPELEAQRAQLDAAEAELDAARPQVEAAKARLAEGRRQLESAEAELAAGQAELAASRRQLDDGWAQLGSAEAELASAASEIASGRAQLADAQRQLDEGWDEYYEGKAAYERERQDALEKLDDAEKELDDAQAEIDDIERPDVFVLDRTKNYGAQSYANDSERIDAIASVFPLFFFIVAALVALTTMTRMVDDERSLIGTYKALGYSTATISAKYLAYAAIASGIGAVIGIAFMSQLLPWVIPEAYGIVYTIPHRPFPLPIEPGPAVSSFLLGLGCTLTATLVACVSSLRETPAALLQPKAPKVGKRILLERIGPLWRKITFSWKVTLRNIFRYKRRFLMTVIGIAGCTGLLVTGFGVRDAISDIIDIQYGELVGHDVMIGLANDATTGEVADVVDYLDETGAAGRCVIADTENVVVRDASGKGDDHAVQLICPENIDEFCEIRTLRERIGHAEVPFEPDSAILTEKLATMLGVGPGDAIRVFEPNAVGNVTDLGHEVTLTGVTENYIQGYLYLGPEAFDEVFGDEPSYDTIYTTMDDDPEKRTEIAKHLQAMDDVDTVVFEDDMIETYSTMLRSVDLVMIVLIVSAAALAFVVLYNLANINISERVREIASLKVLGFTRREVDAYVFREILLIVIGGALVGLVLGYFFEAYVVVTAEVDAAMFGRSVHWPSYVYSFLLTMGFTVLVLLAMRPKLARIDMVESLKSVE